MRKIILLHTATVVAVVACCEVLTAQTEDGVQQAWVAHFGSIPDASASVDTIRFRAATAIDVHKNVYVTGFASSEPGLNIEEARFVTIKYNLDGDTLWIAEFGMSTGGAGAVPLALVVNSDCELFVTGFQTTGFGSSELLTLKYDSLGNLLEQETFDLGGQVNQASAITVDGSGNVYITGEADVAGNNRDFVTIKYDANLNLQWSATFNGLANGFDAAVAIAVANGNVYVTGMSAGAGTNADYATVKYSGSGAQLWVRRYSGSAGLDDMPVDMALDGNENIYVTGSSSETGNGFDITTIKYSSSGNEEWVQSFHKTGNDFDQARSMAVSPAGNVYVTGVTGTGISQLPTGVIQINSAELDFDMVTIGYDTDGNERWVELFDGPIGGDLDVPNDIVLDTEENVYITGVGQDETETQAAFSFGFGVQSSFSITAFVSGGGSSLSITTISPEPPVSIGSGPGDNAVTIKYNSDGEQQWIQSFDTPEGGQDGAFGIDLDEQNNVYITGFSALFNPDQGTFGVKFTTIKYEQGPPGSFCTNAIQLDVDDCGNNMFITSRDEVWFSFVAETDNILITVINQDSGGLSFVEAVVVQGNDCNDLTAITSHAARNPLLPLMLRTNSIVSGDLYRIKVSVVRQTPTMAGSFRICLRDFEPLVLSIEPCEDNDCEFNLVTNADFEQGNVGFISDLTPFTSPPPIATGEYAVVNDASSINGFWSGTGNPKFFGTGMFMAADDQVDGQNMYSIIWSQGPLQVAPNTTYCFRVSANSLPASDFGVDPIVTLVVQGNVSGVDLVATATIPEFPDHWVNLDGKWHSGSNTSVRLHIASDPNGSAIDGNDVGLDNIFFRAEDPGSPSLPPPAVTPVPPLTICPGSCVTFTADSDEPVLFFDWSVRQPPGVQANSFELCTEEAGERNTIDVRAVSLTTGCTGEPATIELFAADVPVPDFAVQPEFPCSGAQVDLMNLTSGGNPPLTFSWNFGDGNFSSDADPSHLYSTPGSYTITLIVTDACGTTRTVRHGLDVAPSTATYNPGCCSGSVVYDLSDPVINTPITSPTVWSAANFRIKGTLKVTGGSKLIVNNGSVIEFDPLGRIVVEAGARLEVISSTLRGLTSCGTMWQGMEIHGDGTKSHSGADEAFQGKVVLRAAVVRDAHHALIAGRQHEGRADAVIAILSLTFRICV